MPHFKINLHRIGGTVELDGVLLDFVRAVKVEATAGGITTVTLECIPQSVELNVRADAEFIDITSLSDTVQRWSAPPK